MTTDVLVIVKIISLMHVSMRRLFSIPRGWIHQSALKDSKNNVCHENKLQLINCELRKATRTL